MNQNKAKGGSVHHSVINTVYSLYHCLPNHASIMVIDRHQGLIVSILFFIPIIVTNLGSMSRVMTKESITRFGLGDNVAVRIENVFSRRLGMFTIVHNNMNVILFEAMDILNVLNHVFDIVMATTELSLFMSDIVDANEESPARARGRRGDEIEGRRDIDGMRSCQLNVWVRRKCFATRQTAV